MLVDKIDIDGISDDWFGRFELGVCDLADGTRLRVPVQIIAGRGPRPRLAIIAGIHGDEPEGMLAIQELAAKLAGRLVRGRLVLVPVANPPAFGAGRRRSPLDGLDLNRMFPGREGGLPTEQLAHRLFQSVVLPSDYVLTLHSWYATGTTLPFVEVNATSSALAAASLAAARASGFERVRLTEWPDGQLILAANNHGIAGMEAELGGQGMSTAENRVQYGQHMVALLQHIGMLEGMPHAHKNFNCYVGRHVIARQGGMLRRHVELDQHVVRDETLGTLHDLHGDPIARIAAPNEGVVVAHRSFVSVNPGDNLFTLFQVTNPDTGVSQQHT